MESTERPTFYYLFRAGDDITIMHMTDVEADQRYQKGQRWLDMPQKTLEDANELKRLLLAERGKR
jgi:hypothetical protein